MHPQADGRFRTRPTIAVARSRVPGGDIAVRIVGNDLIPPTVSAIGPFRLPMRSDVGLLSKFNSVIDFDAKVLNRALYLRVP